MFDCLKHCSECLLAANDLEAVSEGKNKVKVGVMLESRQWVATFVFSDS